MLLYHLESHKGYQFAAFYALLALFSTEVNFFYTECFEDNSHLRTRNYMALRMVYEEEFNCVITYTVSCF